MKYIVRWCVSAAVLLLLSSSAPVRANGPIWRNECIDCPAISFQIGDRGLALDAAGHPHVAYAGDALYYAHFDGATWHLEVIDAAPGILEALTYQTSAAIALDSQDRPHISYLNADHTALRYAQKTAAGWQAQTLETAAPGEEMAFESSIAIDRNDRPHIAYSNYGWLKYAFWTGDHWEIQSVDDSAWVE